LITFKTVRGDGIKSDLTLLQWTPMARFTVTSVKQVARVCLAVND
jgi:hypothetical protein